MPTNAPWLRALIFTLLIPGMISGAAPMTIDPSAKASAGFWRVGWLLIAAGAVIYALCLVRFLAAAGTPAIFFTRHLRFLLGEEPKSLVSKGLYRFSRNPMYLGVLGAIFGQAIVFASLRIAGYGVVAFAFFNVVVVFLRSRTCALRGVSRTKNTAKTFVVGCKAPVRLQLLLFLCGR